MGKSQKKKSMRRHNPVRVPDSHLPKGLSSASSTSSKNEAILPIIQKMESADSTERKWACVAVSNLIQNDPSTRRLLQGKNIVGHLITRLTDSEEEVLVEAMGSLRNLCIDGGYDICAEMYNKNILTPLKTFVPKISEVLSQYLENPKTAPENAQKLTYEFADNVITTLWCLSETSNKALNAINNINLIPFLMSFLASREKLPLAPVVAAAQCLYVLTDDNSPAIQSVKSDAGYVSCLVSIAKLDGNATNVNGKARDMNDPRTITLQVLVTGILRNISPLPPPTPASFIDIDKEIVLPLLQPIISSINLSEVATNVQQLVDTQSSEPSIEKLSIKHVPKSDHKSIYEIELDQMEGKLRTVQLALEVLTGACATLPDPSPASETDEMEEDMDDGNDEDDEVLDEMDIELTTDKDPSSTERTTLIPSLVPALLSLIHPTALSFPPLAAPSPHPPTTSALSAIHISAMECLNNIFLSLASSPNPAVSSDKEAGSKIWNELWTTLGIIGIEWGLGQEKRKEIWEVAVGVLWGVGIVWKGYLTTTEEQIKTLMQFCDSTSDDALKVKCIGALECLAQHPESIEHNRAISKYLISLLPNATSPSPVGTEPMIQATSALIDIYSDESIPYDINFRQEGFLQALVSSVDGVRKAVKGINRHREGGKDLRLRGDEVRQNLVAFIQYRRGLRL
ncbi:ARM repeat-containing protein [Dendrothele bispora CBS 962.96]|uniref:ARM repeat-containing protein n=1 Tax=Dendrothele bispora (strain CBS 962.96) TaxID=1314807 RepID=A0A4S8MFK7_DENBC|nr:ARM repeat-containing protein [Dendrothele bispora CBS 962.96]